MFRTGGARVIEMVRRFLRQRFGSPAMATALGVLALLTAIQAALSEPERALESGFLAIVLIAAGSVSRDASSGALQMILARPDPPHLVPLRPVSGHPRGVRGISRGHLRPHGAPRRGPAAGTRRGVVVRRLAGVARPRRGGGAPERQPLRRDPALLLDVPARVRRRPRLHPPVDPAAGRAAASAGRSTSPGSRRPARRRGENVLPEVDWSEVLRGRHALGEPTGQFVLAVVVFLTLAALIFSRREFSYGHD